MASHRSPVTRPAGARLVLLCAGILVVLASICGVMIPRPAIAEDGDPSRASGSPTRVYAGIYLHDVSRFDLKDGTFDVDAELWAKWSGAFDPTEIRIANASDISRDLLGREDDGDWHSVRWRLRGTLRGEFPVHRFPMDDQRLPIVLELPASQGELVPDLAGSGVYPRFSVTDWDHDARFLPSLERKVYPSDLGQLAFEGEGATLHRVRFDVVLRRPLRPVLLKLFLPLGIVGLVVFASLFVGADMLQPRMTMCVTGLVACFAFQFSISDVLPVVAYLTLADTLFIVVYGIAISCVVGAVASHSLLSRGHPGRALLVSRVLRVLVPLGAGVAILQAVPPPYPPAERSVDPVPTVDRHASSAASIRIGTTQRLRIASLPVGLGSWWEAVHVDPARGPLSVIVERAPRVDNDALRFLADGGLEVEWNLRPDVRWSDGAPIRIEDLLIPLEASPDPYITEIRRTGPRSITLRWSARLARSLDPPTLWPAHIVQERVRVEGYEATRRYLAENAVPGIGPYRIVSADDDRVLAEANPHFVGTPPAIARVEVLRFDSVAEVFAAFDSGTLDATLPLPLAEAELDEARQRFPSSLHVLPASTLLLLQPSLDHPVLRERAARDALDLALNRPRLAELLAGEGGVPSTAPLPCVDTPRKATYDPDAATALLASIGITELELPLTYATTLDETLIAALREDLARIGVQTVPAPVRSTWPMWREGGNEGLLVHSFRAARTQPPPQWWGLALQEGRYPSDVRNAAYTDDVHALVRREARALYPERRVQLQEQLFDAYDEQRPGLPIAFGDERLLIRPELRGWERSAELAFGINLEDWYVLRDEP